ncbi:MAG: MBL fold metallo-hydrolase [Candidatus Promineifilaceae bacterium]
MNTHTYTFTLGHARCTVIADGGTPATLDSMYMRFPNVKKAAMQSAWESLYGEEGEAPWSMNCLLVQTADYCVLVDTGIGAGSRGNTGQLLSRLQAVVPPDAVDTVIITHGHPDHIGGLVQDGQLVFTNAEIVMQQEELAHWQSVAQKNVDYGRYLTPILDAVGSRLKLVNGRVDIVPGIEGFTAPGHTPAHMVLRLTFGDDTLLHIVDAWHSEVQLAHPEWSPRFDTDPQQAAETRAALMAAAADESVQVLAYHLGFPGLGFVRRHGEAFRWETAVASL